MRNDLKKLECLLHPKITVDGFLIEHTHDVNGIVSFFAVYENETPINNRILHLSKDEFSPLCNFYENFMPELKWLIGNDDPILKKG